MNFIEKYFRISPDGGDGSMEIMAVVLIVVLGAPIGLLFPNARKPEDDVN
jgi:hypothetical protein